MAENHSSWNPIVFSMKLPHFLQTEEWAEVKAAVGWKPRRLTWQDSQGNIIAAAQLLVREVRPLPFLKGFKVGYVPRGPLLDWTNHDLHRRVLVELLEIARRERLIFLKIDPEVDLGRGVPGKEGCHDSADAQALVEEMSQQGWIYSPEQVQFKNTVMLDLNGPEAEWLARMKQKTRYNLRLAQKNGVKVIKAEKEDFPRLYRMYAETAARDGFIIRPEAYYLDVWTRFVEHDLATLLVAEVDGEPVAGLVLFHVGETAWYVYGMSVNRHREKMPNYALQWEAMRVAKEKGCNRYDLWGAPDVFDGNDSMAGVFRFKEGLGGEVIRGIGAWDFPLRPLLYSFYQVTLPKLLNITRRIRKGQLKQEVS
jgi:lipid II:glycine glycyltransferase (peptidoglycan interpeptide bridge formation enzyme)